MIDVLCARLVAGRSSIQRVEALLSKENTRLGAIHSEAIQRREQCFKFQHGLDLGCVRPRTNCQERFDSLRTASGSFFLSYEKDAKRAQFRFSRGHGTLAS